MDPNDLTQLSDADLNQLIAQKQQEAAAPVQDSTPNNMAIAASKGLAAGLQTAATAPGLLLRDITDKFGITDPQVSEAQRQANADLYAVAKQAGVELNAPGSAKAGEVLGEYGPTLALGGAALAGAKGLLGAGRVADVAANAISGAATSGLQDTNGDLGQRGENALAGGAFGGVLAGVAQGAGKLLKPLLGGDLNPDALASLQQAGIRPRASQVLSQADSPRAQPFWEGVENTLNKIPFFGIKGVVKSGTRKAQDAMTNIVNELDSGTPATAPMWKTLEGTVDSSKYYKLGNVRRTVDEAFNSLANTKGLKRNPGITDYIAQLQEDLKSPLNFQELHKVRQAIDTSIDTIRGNISNPASREEFAALAKIRGSVSNALGAAARLNNRAREWNTINQATQNRMFMDGIVRARDAATSGGGRVFEIGKFNRALTNEMDYMTKDMRLPIPSKNLQAITNLKKLSDLFASDKVKAGAPGMAIALPALAGLAAGTAGAAPTAAVIAPVAAISKGLGLIATTESGIQMLSRMGKITAHNPKVRQIAMTAFALAHADETRGNMQDRQTHLQNLSDEDLNRMMQEAQNGQGAQ